MRDSRRAPLAFAPVFDSRALLVVDFERVRIHLVRPGSGEVVLDTVVSFPSDADSITLSLSVLVQGTSEDFSLTLAMISAAGDTVFRAGPAIVTAAVGVLTRAPSEIPTVYVGTGANAASVRFTAALPPAVFFGDTVVVLAAAFDSAGRAIAGTPVIYRIDSRDTALARVPDPRVGHVVVKSVRGPARVIAELLTHQTDTATLYVQPRPSAIAVRSGGGQTAAAGTVLAQPLVVRVTAADGLGVEGVVVGFAVTSGGGTLSVSADTTDASGDASTVWTLGNTPGSQAVTVTSGSLAGSPLTITATATTTSVPVASVTVSPATATLAVGATQQLAATTSDAAGATLTGRVVTWTSSSTSVATVSGSGLVTGVAAGSATITATSEGVSGTATVTVTAAVPVASVTVAPATATVTVGATQQLTATPKDAAGATLTGRTVTWASSNAAVATVSSSGLVTAVAVGTDTIAATSEGVSGRAVITVSAQVSIVSTTVTPHLDTLTALGASGTFHLVAQAKDGSGSPMAGHFTWVSRTLTYVTVDTNGVVTGLANGSAWVVATEAGGTKDSALIVVQQRLATILVTPGTRSLYLTGHFAFTASAVDGGGTPIPTQPTFTWSTTAPAVATVDTAGHVVGVGLGVAQIRATSGVVIGVANVSVLTPITRIAVVVDTVGAFRTDTFTFTSLGLTRRYRAIAHDTLDAVMTGIPFTWVSTNGSVAQLLGFDADTARVVSAANGVTSVNATAQGFLSNPGAQLNVQQVLAAIALTPPAPQVAVTGTVGLVARGLDANGRFISGGSFIFHSATPAVATVDSVTGRVTGVALGTANITASSGVITSNPAVVTVSATVPAAISFGRDTVSVGRGSSASIPILLSMPAASALTVNLTATAYAHWSTASVTIPAGQTAVNATLVGDSAGTTTVTATDGSSLGYAGASAVAKVTANMRLASNGFGINTTDIVTTQVLLSDPSPAGGTYVTFNYSTAGVARVSPDPAFIPAGQLAADIQILAAGAGSTNITPNAIGVNGQSASFTAYAPVLTPNYSSIYLGQGQYQSNASVQTPTYTNLAVPVTITSSDSTVATATPSVTIPAGAYYASFTIAATGTGTANVTVAANGWTAAHGISVRVSTPALSVCCANSSLFTTSPQATVSVYTTDSTGASHPRVNALVVHLRSSRDSVITLLDSVVTVQPGYYYNNSGRYVMGGTPGTAWIVATASGHKPDSVQYTVSGPPLAINFGYTYPPMVGVGQTNSSYSVSTPNYLTQSLTVTLTSSDTTKLGLPASVTIPTGSYYAYFTATGKAPGVDTIQFTAPGYGSIGGAFVVSPPRLTACCNATVNNFSGGGSVSANSTDSAYGAHPRVAPLTVSLYSTDTTKVRLDSSSLTIPAGQYYSTSAHWTPLDTGTAKIIFSAPGHPARDTLTITIVTPQLYLSLSSSPAYPTLLGRRQHFNPSENGFTVQTPDYRATALATTIVQKHATVDSLTTTTPTIAQGAYYQYLDAYGLATGGDTLIVSAPGYRPDTAYITVTTPKLTNGGLSGSATTTSPPFNVYVYATDSVGNGHYLMDTLVVAAVPSDSNVIRFDSLNRFFRIPKNLYYAYATAKVVGPGTATVTFSDSAGTGYGSTTTNAITVTGPTLSLSGTTMLGMRQHHPSGWYVQVPNYLASPLVVHLLSTGPRVATVPDSLVLPAGSYYASFDVTAQDTVGTIQIQATATGYGGAATNVQVTVPKFAMYASSQLNTTSGRTGITIYAQDANGTQHYTTEDVTVTLLSSAPSVAGIDSGTVTIPKDASYNNHATWGPAGTVGTSQLTATDPRSARYAYGTGTVTVAVITPTLYIYSAPAALGLGQYQDYAYVQAPDYQPSALAVTFTHTGTPRVGTYANLTNTPITSVTIPQGQYYTSFRMAGLTRGTDTLTASATSPAHNPSTVTTVVDSGRVDPLGNWPASIAHGDSVQVTLYARDLNTNAHNVVAATPFTLAPNANIEFHLGGAVVTTVTIPADAQYVQFYLVGKTAGSGSVTITNANYKSYQATVTVS